MKRLLIAITLLIQVIITTGAGYVGTLPDVEAEFSYMKKEKNEQAVSPYTVEELDKVNEQKLKPIPLDDENYVDIIIKRDKTSAYTNDLNSIIRILEKLRRCLNTNQDIQMFNAIVSNLIDNIEYIHNEYKNKAESNYLSYKRLLELEVQARETATFRMNGLAILKYKPYTSKDNIFTKENLEEKLESLLNNVNETIFILKNLE